MSSKRQGIERERERENERKRKAPSVYSNKTEKSIF
jgi:hypothetical protein